MDKCGLGFVEQHTIFACINGIFFCHIDGSQTAATVEPTPVEGFYASRDIDGRQTGATIEGLFTDTGHTSRDGDGCQVGAPFEGLFTDTGHTSRDGDGCQVGAILECLLTDACHRGRDRNVCQRCVVIANISADIRHTIADDHCCNFIIICLPRLATWITALHLTCARNDKGVVGGCANNFPSHLGFMALCSTIATGDNWESQDVIFIGNPIRCILIGPHTCRWHINLAIISIISESTAPECWRSRSKNDNGCQAGAIKEGTIADGRHTGRDGD